MENKTRFTACMRRLSMTHRKIAELRRQSSERRTESDRVNCLQQDRRIKSAELIRKIVKNKYHLTNGTMFF